MERWAFRGPIQEGKSSEHLSSYERDDSLTPTKQKEHNISPLNYGHLVAWTPLTIVVIILILLQISENFVMKQQLQITALEFLQLP